MRSVRLIVLGSLLLFGFSFAGCYGGGLYGPLGATCPALSSNANPLAMRFSANAVADAKVRTFVAAAKDLVGVSLQMQNEATEACRRMGVDLGLNPASMQPHSDDPGASAQAACDAVAAAIHQILSTGVRLQVQVRPPQCQANLQAKAQCDGACHGQINPGEIVARCTPARLSGYCNGTCEGGCNGTCTGQCQGQCSARGANGECTGQCNGTCSGRCSGTCHASCRGQWQAPQCEGYVQPPSADAECNASCNAHAQFTGSCTPAVVNVAATENTQMAGRLAATLRANLPELLHAEIALGSRLVQSARVVVDVGAQLPKIVGDAGAQALACIAAAGSASVQASARINVSVRASASVSGQVGSG
jgi:hypothetical protein